jgi:hypothetical protein
MNTKRQFVVREDPRLYALIQRYPWIIAVPPVPPGLLRLAGVDPDGDPARRLP